MCLLWVRSRIYTYCLYETSKGCKQKHLIGKESTRFKSVIDNVSRVKYRNLDTSGIYQPPHTGSPPVQTGPGAHPASCTMGTGSFSGVKSGRGVLLTTHPLLVLRSWKSRAIPLPTLWATPGLLRDHFTFFF